MNPLRKQRATCILYINKADYNINSCKRPSWLKVCDVHNNARRRVVFGPYYTRAHLHFAANCGRSLRWWLPATSKSISIKALSTSTVFGTYKRVYYNIIYRMHIGASAGTEVKPNRYTIRAVYPRLQLFNFYDGGVGSRGKRIINRTFWRRVSCVNTIYINIDGREYRDNRVQLVQVQLYRRFTALCTHIC